MTRDEILAMPAGREMDVMVAERVMGLWYVDDPDVRGAGGIPHKYSTDIAAAWEVVEKLISDSHWDTSLHTDYNDSGRVWRVHIENVVDGDAVVGTAIAPTAPLAICRAALLAVMEDENV